MWTRDDGRVDSQTVNARSGLMDNVPLDHKLLLPRHDWDSFVVHSFNSCELTIQLLQFDAKQEKGSEPKKTSCNVFFFFLVINKVGFSKELVQTVETY